MTTEKPQSLRDLVGKPAPLTVGELTIQVKPLGWYSSVDVIDAILPALDGMPFVPGQKAGELSPAEFGAWASWIHVYRDDVVLFCALATGQEKADIADLPVPLMLELIFGILEINADFFVKSLPGLAARVGDRVNGLVAKVMKALQASQKTSSTSSRTVTASAS